METVRREGTDYLHKDAYLIIYMINETELDYYQNKLLHTNYSLKSEILFYPKVSKSMYHGSVRGV